MSRVHVKSQYETTSGDAELLGWYDPDKCREWKEDTNWNGSNFISVATGLQWEHEVLYRTRGGRWIIHWWSQWQGSFPKDRFVDEDTAREWLLTNDHDEAVQEFWGEIPEEEGPAPKDQVKYTMLLDEDMVAAIDQAANQEGVSRAEWIREATRVRLAK